jgi:hypothetical protein
MKWRRKAEAVLQAAAHATPAAATAEKETTS